MSDYSWCVLVCFFSVFLLFFFFFFFFWGGGGVTAFMSDGSDCFFGYSVHE